MLKILPVSFQKNKWNLNDFKLKKSLKAEDFIP